MAIPGLARISRSVLKASISSLEGNEYGRSVCLQSATKARRALSFGEVGQVAGGSNRSCRYGLQSNLAGGAGAGEGMSRQADRRNVIYGSVVEVSWFWRSLAVFPTVAGNEIGSSARRFSSTGPLAAGGPAIKVKVKSLDHVVLTVKDIEASCKFYSDVLGMEVVKFHGADGSHRVALTFGDQKINLHKVGEEVEPKADRPTAGSADLCFITDTHLHVVQKHIESNNVAILQGPVARTGARGPIQSVYLRDPDQNLIEVSQY